MNEVLTLDDKSKYEYIENNIEKILANPRMSSRIIDSFSDATYKIRFFKTYFEKINLSHYQLDSDFFNDSAFTNLFHIFLKTNITHLPLNYDLSIFQKLLKLNSSFFQSASSSFLDYNILSLFFTDYKSLTYLSEIVNDDIQYDITSLYEKNHHLLISILEKTLPQPSFKDIIFNILINLNLNENLCADITTNIDTLPPNIRNTTIDNLILLLSSNNQIPEFSFEDIINYQDNINDYIHTNSSSKDPKILRKCIFLKQYGIEEISFKGLSEIYHFTTDETYSPEELSIIEEFHTINHLLSSTNVQELQTVLQNTSSNNHLTYNYEFEDKLRKIIATHLIQSLFNIKELKPLPIHPTPSLPVYDISNENFFLLISVVESPNQKDWNIPKNKFHSFCTSLISNEMIKCIADYGVHLGFINLSFDVFLYHSPRDVKSENNRFSVREDQGYANRRFFTPQNLINYTRDGHNEIVLERIDYGTKINPDFILCTVSEFTKTLTTHLTKEELSKLPPHQRLDYQNWQEALTASKSFNVPIVIIDKKKLLSRNIIEINDLLTRIHNHEYNLIFRMMEKLINNRIGYADTPPLQAQIDQYISIILENLFALAAKLSTTNTGEALQVLTNLENWLNFEVEEKLANQGNYHNIPSSTLHINIAETISRIAQCKSLLNIENNPSLPHLK